MSAIKRVIDCAAEVHVVTDAEERAALAELSALRSRVEALERALNRADLFFELTCNTLEEMLGDDVPEDRQREVCEGMIAAIRDYDRARAALQPDKGSDCPTCHHRHCDLCSNCGQRCAQSDKGERCPDAQPNDPGKCYCDGPGCVADKGEQCGGTGAIPRGELTKGAIRRACLGCPDCSEAP